MAQSLPYRIVAGALAAVLLMFSVGVPVMTHFCPMPAMTGGMSCAMCHPPVHPGSAPAISNPPCCAPVVAAERNTNAFVQAEKNTAEVKAVVLAFLPPPTALPLSSDGQHTIALPASSSPPGRDADLPVLHSSLLI